ncbi:amino acid adenylation domain-containing protein [Kitasatospora sp. NPDC058201]|uniref:amino acid adenylation domain-containing protein n=1 Tax=unclassified Kitasatospora TaxID=2633591 RepID=UPI00364F266B
MTLISSTQDDGSLSYTQESLWLFHHLARPDEPAYNESLAFELAGKVDPAAVRGAVRAAVERHEALRTRFRAAPDGLPRAEVLATVPDTLDFTDLRTLEPAEADARAEHLLADHHHRPFDLGAAPLLRTLLVALPEDRWLLTLTAHHIVVDDWSLRLVLEEVGEDVRAITESGHPVRRPGPAATFRDFVRSSRAAFERGEYAEQIEAWRHSLAHSPDLLGMPLDRPRQARPTFRGSSRTLTVPLTEVEPLLEAGRRECRATAFPVFLAAYAALLNRYTGQDGFAIGTTVLNRPTEADLSLVGCFVNTLPLALPVDREAPFRDLLEAAREATDRLLDDGDAPYPKVLEALGAERAVNHNPVFQTMLTLLGPEPELDLGPETTARYRPVRRTAAKFDLMLYIARTDGGYEFELEFNTDLFDPETAERLLGNYARLLRALATSVDAPVGAPSMLGEDEERLILDTWNDTAKAYPPGTVVDVIEEQVRRTPDAVAVEYGDRLLTYDLLNRRANQVARALRAGLGDAPGGVSRGPFVGVYMERSVEMVVALLAIVKAGCAYVPIDPDYPAARIEFMIQDAGLPLILTQERHRAALEATGTGGAALLVLPDPALDTEDDADPVRALRPDSPVYMIYTSGSTGQPKGVINRHDSLANRLHWMQDAFALTGEDKVLQKTPYSFDVSVWEFFWPLMVGAAVVVAEPGGHRDPEYLKRVIRDHRVTTVHFVPSMLNVFLEAEELTEHCNSLRRVVCSGEALPRRTLEVFAGALDCELHNLYGPTEAAIDVSHWACTLDYPGQVVPIGTPIANVRLYVTDRHQVLQPVGVPGELCIGGVAVAAGYHRRDELSAKVFLDDPYGTEPGARLYRTGDLARFLPDGRIQYLGRIDNQVKLRGLRVEPDEVAAVLRELPGVQDAAVVVHTTGAAQALAAYVVPTGDGLDAEDLRSRLRGRLPEFLVPQYLVAVPDLPTTPNGKLDRRALPDPVAAGASARSAAALAGPRQHEVARVWREVLGVGEVGADDRFFALGGDSILALRVAARLREAGYAVELRDVIALPTVAELAAALEERDPQEPAAAADPGPFGLVGPADRALLPADALDAWPLTRLQSGMIYHSLLDEDSPVYHDIFDYEFSGEARSGEASSGEARSGGAEPDEADAEVRAGQVRQAIAATVARHPQLRSCFDLERYGEPLQIVLPRADAAVEVVDLTGLDRGGQDRAIAQWVEQEKLRPFDLAAPPVRFRVHLRDATRFNLGVSFHHLILDGWSVALVVAGIRERYAELLAGREPAEPAAEPGFGGYVALERASATSAAEQEAWRRLLAGFPATLPAGPQPDGSVETATLERDVPAELAERLRRSAAGLGAPLKSVYLAAHCAALADLTGTARLITALVGHGRPEVPGGTEMVGLFLNTVPLPVEVPETPGPDLVAAVFAAERAVLPHRRFPLAEIERLRGGPQFDVVFNYTDFHAYTGPADGVRIDGARYFELTSFPMVVHVHKDQFDGVMRLAVCHDPGRIKSSAVERFLDGLLEALESLAAPDAPGQVAAPDTGEPLTLPGARAPEAAPAAPHTAADDRPAGAETAIAGIIATALGVDALAVDANYLDAGVDSITSIRILAKIRKLFPAAVMRDVIELRTARALAHRLESRDRDAVQDEPVPAGEGLPAPTADLPDGVVDAYPATAMQLQMIGATRRDPAQSAYHDVFAYTVRLPLDEQALREALRRATASTATLRTAFLLDARPVPLQHVHAAVEPDLVVDATGRPGAADEWFERERGSGFTWDRPGLIRFAAHRTGAEGFVLSFGFHHAVIDGWSLSLLVRDLLTSYAASLSGDGPSGESPSGPAPQSPVPPAPAYRDYVRAEVAARDSQQSRAFWREVLRDHPGTPLPRFAPDGTGSRWTETTLTVPAGQEAALREVARQAGCPPKYLMLAAHLRVLALISGRQDVVTGVFTHGRPEAEGAERMTGMFLNFQPHRARLDDRTWNELVEAVFRAEARALPHRRYPTAAVARDVSHDRAAGPAADVAAGADAGLDALGRVALFPALFNYTEFPAYAEAADGGAVITDVRWFEHTDVPFLVNVGRDIGQSRLELTVNADGRLLPQAVTEAVARLNVAVLTQITTDPTGRVLDTTDEIRAIGAELRARQLPTDGEDTQNR